MTKKTMLRRLLTGFSVFVVLALAILLLRAVDPNTESFTKFVDTSIRSNGVIGIAMYIGLVGLLVCVGIPRHLLSFVGGYAFGAFFGTVWATLGVTLGCVLSFTYARFLGQRFVQNHFGSRIDKLENFLLRAPFTMTFIVRSLPIGNNLVTNILAGVTRIPAPAFFVGSCAGYLPQNFIFALLGSGINVDPFWRTLVSATCFLLASVAGLLLYRHFLHDVDELNPSS
jgi:uncharacterized membrane protein YdjX (TVP38/TMEM64 family)